MPPKRKAPAAKTKAGGKKAKKTVPEEPSVSTTKDAITKLKTQSNKKSTHKPDKVCPVAASTEVYDDYDCMLNQTNIGHNNNKYYVIQVLKHPTAAQYYSWNRWGRVGEKGSNSLKGPFKDADAAIKDFEKKFKDKTRNSWSERDKFTPMAGKYTLIEMADEEEDEVDAPKVDISGKKVVPSKLDKTTQQLISLIFDHDMFNSTMKSFDIDVKKMPLGKLSKIQIAKGFEVLEKIEDELKKSKPNNKTLMELSSKFYTVIPHDFGRMVPPVINTSESLQKKMDMLAVLGDIEIATSLEKDQEKAIAAGVKDEMVPNPLDINYKLLMCGLELVNPKSKEFQIISKYTDNTIGYRKVKIRHVWKVNRDGEDKKFKAHDKIPDRKLLWHGTSVAVVAAILKSGLRIMPHSGGRVGKGIYFASENGKSAGYVGVVNKTGIMFLNEVVLGKEKHITMDDSSLTAAPKGYDCVVAKGIQEPDPKQDTAITIDGKKVVVPQGKPVKQSAFSGSHFSQSEYLIYKENQNRIRYLLLMDFAY
ncbi:protein mono-ADP-ribosyltransferase PARP3-like [Gigantopelta aegis]|uniref:protein mono-ADP-ribosyltransferase PARP3-like n=1 Tax=Gigantopelta aegis TaxID=1735272 RepID=UPI001B8883DE|nr:protein mono-ADP-ribosyltransferase PARP3-like [Gigantopelta aegis]